MSEGSGLAVVLILVGGLLAYGGATGTLAAIFAAVFDPSLLGGA